MKKLLFFVVIIIMTSCTISLEDSKIENPQRYTTIEIQNTIIDSCVIIATDNRYIYILDKKTNLVEYKLTPLDDDHEPISLLFLSLIILFCAIFLGITMKTIIDNL